MTCASLSTAYTLFLLRPYTFSHQFADPWAALEKPERFGRDVRVINPLKSIENKERARQEKNSGSKVPSRHRAPDFQVAVSPPRSLPPVPSPSCSCSLPVPLAPLLSFSPYCSLSVSLLHILALSSFSYFIIGDGSRSAAQTLRATDG